MSKTKNKFIILLESTNDEKISKKQTENSIFIKNVKYILASK